MSRSHRGQVVCIFGRLLGFEDTTTSVAWVTNVAAESSSLILEDTSSLCVMSDESDKSHVGTRVLTAAVCNGNDAFVLILPSSVTFSRGLCRGRPRQRRPVGETHIGNRTSQTRLRGRRRERCQTAVNTNVRLLLPAPPYIQIPYTVLSEITLPAAF